VLSTFEHRSTELADQHADFQAPVRPGNPQLYLQLHHPEQNAVNEEFVKKSVNFKKGVTDIGYGLRPNHPLEQVANNNGYPGADGKPKGNPNNSSPITFDDFKAFVSEYTVEKASEISGVPKERLIELAKLYATRRKKWCPTGPWFQPAYARHLGQQHDLQRAPC